MIKIPALLIALILDISIFIVLLIICVLLFNSIVLDKYYSMIADDFVKKEIIDDPSPFANHGHDGDVFNFNKDLNY